MVLDAHTLSVPTDIVLRVPRCSNPFPLPHLHAVAFVLSHVALFVMARRKPSEAAGLSVVGHYLLAWLAVLTSPRGTQLDVWLLAVVLMDVGPVCVAAWRGVRLGLLGRDEHAADAAISHMIDLLDVWSPGVQMSRYLLDLVDFQPENYLFTVAACATFLVEGHEIIFDTVYCR